MSGCLLEARGLSRRFGGEWRLPGGRAPTVHAVEDGMPVQADHVYVMPPNTSMTVRDGVLHLAERSGEADRHLPVDAFFTALAEDQGSRAVAIILSGTASDGTQGMKAIKAASSRARRVRVMAGSSINAWVL